MPLLNSFYAWLLALVAYGTVDFNDYTLLETNDKGFSFYLDETENKIIEQSIDNHLIAYTLTTLPNTSNSWQQFFIGIKSIEGFIVAGLVGYIHEGTVRGIKSDAINCDIGLIWVDEAYRHQGLGTLLIEQAENYAAVKGCKEIKTLKLYQIDDAVGFFEKMGFVYRVITPSPEHLKGNAVFEVMVKTIDTIFKNKSLPTYFKDNEYQIIVGQPHGDRTPLDILRFGTLMTISDMTKAFTDPVLNLITSYEVKSYVTQLDKKLDAYRKSQGGSKSENKFTIFILSPDKKIIGGAIGEVESFPDFGNWLNIHDVGIDENYRKHQLGRQLFKQVDEYAKSKNCRYIELWTGEWQARGFYEKVGFTVVTTFPRSEHDWNQEGYILRKQLE